MTASYTDLMEEARIEQEIEKLVGNELRSSDSKAPTIMRDVSDPDERMTIFSTLTGEPRAVPLYMLPKTMRKRLPTGKLAFASTQDEALPWKQGEVPCYLNPKHPRYVECVEMGIVSEPCVAEHLSSVYSQRIHMQNRHRQEWATITENDKLMREEEERIDRRAMADAARQAVEAPTRRGRGSSDG
jgi:hypothetical protein